MEGDVWEGDRFGGVRCPREPCYIVAKVHYIYALEVGQLSCENNREERKNACCVVEVVSGQFDVVHIVSEVLCRVEDCRESMEGCAVGKLDEVEKPALGVNAPIAADKSTAVEGANVDEALASSCPLVIQHIDYIFTDLSWDMQDWWPGAVDMDTESECLVHQARDAGTR